MPKTNTEYWKEKIARNVTRDRDTDERLESEGWVVLRFWEHQSAEDCAEIVRQTVAERRPRQSVA